MIGPNYLSFPRSFSLPSLTSGNDNADLNGRQGMRNVAVVDTSQMHGMLIQFDYFTPVKAHFNKSIG